MIDLKKRYTQSLEEIYNEYLESLTYLTKSVKDQKTRAKEILAMNNLIVDLITKTESIYTVEYNSILNIETHTIDEELEKLEKLRDIVKNRKQYIIAFLNKHKKSTSIEMSNQFESILQDNKLDSIEEKIAIIKKYKMNNQEIKESEEEITNIDSELFEIKNNRSRAIEENESFEKDLNGKINELIEPYDLERYDPIEVETNYLEYKELYQKTKEKINKTKNPSSELLDTYHEAEVDYKRYNNIYHLLKLREISKMMSTVCEDCLAKRKTIKTILNNIKGHDVEIALQELLSDQNTVLNNQKKEIARELILINKKGEISRKLDRLKEENADENITYIVSRFSNETSPEIDNTTIGIIKNPSSVAITSPNGLVIESVENLETSTEIIEKNKEKAKEWMQRVQEKLDNDQTKTR